MSDRQQTVFACFVATIYLALGLGVGWIIWDRPAQDSRGDCTVTVRVRVGHGQDWTGVNVKPLRVACADMQGFDR